MAVREPIDQGEYEPLARDVHGEVLQPGDDDYDEARSIWNGMIDRKPVDVVRPTGAADVMTAVDFARERGLPISPTNSRSGAQKGRSSLPEESVSLPPGGPPSPSSPGYSNSGSGGERGAIEYPRSSLSESRLRR